MAHGIAPAPMYASFEDVTSKVAFSYAKQQAFVYLAIAVAAVTAGAIYLERGSPIDLVGDLALLAGAAGALAIALPRKDLGRINRPCLRLFAICFVVKLGATGASDAVTRGGGAAPAGDLGLLLLLGVGVVGYAFPLRRGGTVLYAPAAVRELANGRTVALAGAALLVLFAARFVVPGGMDGVGNDRISPALLGAVGAAAGLAAIAIHLVRPTGVRALRVGEVAIVLGALAGAAGALGAAAPGAAWAVAAGPLGAGGAAVGLIELGSSRLNRGKAIVARRG
jgi:hypothetical protein